MKKLIKQFYSLIKELYDLTPDNKKHVITSQIHRLSYLSKDNHNEFLNLLLDILFDNENILQNDYENNPKYNNLINYYENRIDHTENHALKEDFTILIATLSKYKTWDYIEDNTLYSIRFFQIIYHVYKYHIVNNDLSDIIKNNVINYLSEFKENGFDLNNFINNYLFHTASYENDCSSEYIMTKLEHGHWYLYFFMYYILTTDQNDQQSSN